MGTLRSRLVEIVVGQFVIGALSHKSGAVVRKHSVQQRVVPRILVSENSSRDILNIPGLFISANIYMGDCETHL